MSTPKRTAYNDLEAIEDAFVQNILDADGQSLREEFTSAGFDPDRIVFEIGSTIERAKTLCAKQRLETARAELAAFRSRNHALTSTEREAAHRQLERARSGDREGGSEEMVDPLKKAASAADETHETKATAGQEELTVLERLADGLLATIAELLRSQRSGFEAKPSLTDLSLHEVKRSMLKGYEELAHHSYGRTVLGSEVDESGRQKGKFTYRITQANVGYIEGRCNVLARNSPLASALVTARPGAEAEAVIPRGARYFEIDEVRTFEGPISLRSPSRKPDFRSMALQRKGFRRPLVVENLRSFVQGLLTGSAHAEISAPSTATTPRAKSDAGAFPPSPSGVAPGRHAVGAAEVAGDPMWLADWKGIYLGDSETLSLGHQFFTRTTLDQEKALNNPRGLTFVEGIAGAGKTSVALGRLKFFANFETGEHREHYGLQNAPLNDFSPIGMVGFVLSHSLKRYLKETAIALGLERLPIRDFEEFRTDLANQFGLAQRFRRRKAGQATFRTRMAWLRALDIAVARVAGRRLRETVLKTRNVAPLVQQAVFGIADELTGAELDLDTASFRLSGLAARVMAAVAESELRSREAAARARDELRREPVELDRVLRRLQQDAERRIISPLGRVLLGVLAAHDLVLPAVQLEAFPALVRQAFGAPRDAVALGKLDSSVAEFRILLEDKDSEGRSELNDADFVALSALAAIVADDFDYVDPPGYLYQLRKNTAVFIDEVQDFTELEVFLMGMTTKTMYHQITLSGDRCQRLQSEGTEAYANLFPFVPRARQNKPMFLDQNFRQREELGALSAGFRSVLQGDARVDFELEGGSFPCAPVYAFQSREGMAHLILERIRTVNSYATIAVITPSLGEAQRWYGLLEDDLAAYHRPALMSRRDDLTRRFDVHFTDVRETKGLEFNVVIIPDLGSFALDTVVGRNQAYVAISRAKQALLIGCDEQTMCRPEIEQLIRNKLLRIAGMPLYLAH